MYEKFYSKWTPILVNGNYYIINIVPYYNRYLIGLISADNLIRPLRQINLGANGYASLVDENGANISNLMSNSGKILQDDTGISNLVKSRTTIINGFSNTTFSAKMVIKLDQAPFPELSDQHLQHGPNSNV